SRKACPTDSGLKADQDRANIPKTSTLPSDSTPRVTSLAADKGSMQQKLNELIALCTSLQRQQSDMISKFAAQELEINRLKARIKLLEDKDRGVAERSGDVRGGVQVVPTIAEVVTAIVSIPTGSGVVSTASPTIPTATPIFTTATESTPYTRRKGKETVVESETPNKKKDNSKKLKTSEEVPEEKLKEMMELIPVEEVYVEALQIDAQVARELEEQQEREDMRMNKQISRDVEVAVAKYLQEYQQFASELPLEKKIELIIEWKLYETCGVHHVTSKDKEIFMLVEKDYPLRKGLAIVMISNKLQVENYSQMANDLILKIYKIANCPRQQDD
nr:hypothetical protein [Tanacetum cinerariifolium]